MKMHIKLLQLLVLVTPFVDASAMDQERMKQLREKQKAVNDARAECKAPCLKEMNDSFQHYMADPQAGEKDRAAVETITNKFKACMEACDTKHPFKP